MTARRTGAADLRAAKSYSFWHARISDSIVGVGRKPSLHSAQVQPILTIFGRSRPTLDQWLALGVVATAAVLSDHLTKRLITARLAAGATADALGPFTFHHTDNHGIVLGVVSARAWLLAAAAAIVVVCCLAYFGWSGCGRPSGLLAIGLLVGGSGANLLDLIRFGHVTDFVAFHVLPVFNLADVFVVSGIVLLAVELRPGSVERLRSGGA